eukprot:scaffold1289_cov274-Pinguiococcus_pyrenoidosus.AAC.18
MRRLLPIKICDHQCFCEDFVLMPNLRDLAQMTSVATNGGWVLVSIAGGLAAPLAAHNRDNASPKRFIAPRVPMSGGGRTAELPGEAVPATQKRVSCGLCQAPGGAPDGARGARLCLRKSALFEAERGGAVLGRARGAGRVLATNARKATGGHPRPPQRRDQDGRGAILCPCASAAQLKKALVQQSKKAVKKAIKKAKREQQRLDQDSSAAEVEKARVALEEKFRLEQEGALKKLEAQLQENFEQRTEALKHQMEEQSRREREKALSDLEKELNEAFKKRNEDLKSKMRRALQAAEDERKAALLEVEKRTDELKKEMKLAVSTAQEDGAQNRRESDRRVEDMKVKARQALQKAEEERAQALKDVEVERTKERKALVSAFSNKERSLRASIEKLEEEIQRLRTALADRDRNVVQRPGVSGSGSGPNYAAPKPPVRAGPGNISK